MERTHRTQPAAPTALSIVLVDPDQENTNTLGGLLQGHHVRAVGTAREAWRIMTMQHVHVLVTELDLPDVDGIELLKSTRGSPQTQDVLLMVMTRRASISSKIAAFQAGADDYLVKPVTADTLVLHLRRLLGFRRLFRN